MDQRINQSEYDRAYQNGLDDMRERLIAMIHNEYSAQKGYHGKDHHTVATLNGLILDIREDQGKEIDALKNHTINHDQAS